MIATRKFRSSPYRDSGETWAAIVHLLTQSDQSGARLELERVSGIVASCIADQATKSAPIIVTCDGPRTRIYCLYDDDALDETDLNEDMLGFNPLKGNWAISLPCTKDDLNWVQSGLKKLSTRILARDLSLGIEEDKTTASGMNELTLNLKGFLGQ